MKEQNGILIFEKGDKLPDLPQGLRTDIEVISLYGFSIVEVDGRPIWMSGTEQDYRKSESQRLNILPDLVEVERVKQCYNIGPTKCISGGGPGEKDCRLAYNPLEGYFYCICL